MRGQKLYFGRKIRDVTPHSFHMRTKEEMRPTLHNRQDLPSLMTWTFDPRGPDPEPLDRPNRQDNPGFPLGLSAAPPPAGGEITRAVDQLRERSRPRSPSPDSQLIHIPISDGDDDWPSQTGRQRQRSRSHERSYPHAGVLQGPQIQPMIIQEPVTDRDEDSTVGSLTLNRNLTSS